jgi:hypothetical protein
MSRTFSATTLLALSFVAANLAGCESLKPSSMTATRDGQQTENTEIHRGFENLRKSSPDSGQSPGGDGLGGGGWGGVR